MTQALTQKGISRDLGDILNKMSKLLLMDLLSTMMYYLEGYTSAAPYSGLVGFNIQNCHPLINFHQYTKS